jgi:hypothetical protein
MTAGHETAGHGPGGRGTAIVVAVAAVSGAPGVSCTALGIAARWPGHPGLLVEADPSGAVMAARFRLPGRPGLNDLAAAVRHGAVVDNPAPFAQPCPFGDVITGPGDAREAAGAVAVLGAYPDAAVAHLAPVVVLDVGRLYPDSPALGVLAAADVIVLLTEPGDEYLHHLYTRLPQLRRTSRAAFGLAIAGKSAYPMSEIAGQLGLPVWAQLPRDKWGAGALTGRMTGRHWSRTRLGQSLTALAGHTATAALDQSVHAEVPS